MSCKHDGTVIFIAPNGVRVGGARDGGRDRVPATTCVLKLDGYNSYKLLPAKTKTFDGLPEFDCFFVQDPYTIEIAWPNNGVPDLVPEFLPAVVEYVNKHRRSSDDPGHLTIACQGGHGRTGTALATLLITYRKITAYAAVRWLRQNYCERAVESLAQFAWLCAWSAKVQGLPIEDVEAGWADLTRKASVSTAGDYAMVGGVG